MIYDRRRAVDDHELILNQVVKGNNYSFIIRRFLLDAKVVLSTSKYRKIFSDAAIRPREMMEPCLLQRLCVGGVCGGLDDYVRALLCMLHGAL